MSEDPRVSEPTFIPRFREDGSVDPSCLDDRGDAWIFHWLTSRLSGHDPYFPIDRRVEEDPDALVVSILREIGRHSPTWASIARSIRLLLYQAGHSAPEVPASFSHVLRICQQQTLGEVGGWFASELESLAENPENGERRWGRRLFKEILYAAVRQAPGIPSAASRGSWLVLLRDPLYTTIALRGLGPQFYQRLPFLNEWWEVCPEEERQKHLDNMIFSALKSLGDQDLRLPLNLHHDRFSTNLKMAINSALERYGTAKVFRVRGGVYESSIFGAGQLRDYMTEDLPS